MAVLSTNTLAAGLRIVLTDHDPSVVATDAIKGSMIINAATGLWYQKLTSGNNTDVSIVDVGGVGGGQVNTVQGGTDIGVDASDPVNPIVNFNGTTGGQVDSIVGGTDITVDASDPVNPIVNFAGVAVAGQVFTATVGTGKAFTNVNLANIAFQASGLPQAVFFLFGAVVVGANITIKQNIDFVGVVGAFASIQAALLIDGTISGPGVADTESRLARFYNLSVTQAGATHLENNGAACKIEFYRCGLNISNTSTAQFWRNNSSNVTDVYCQDCSFSDQKNNIANGFFLSNLGGTVRYQFDNCSGSSPSVGYFVNQTSSTADIHLTGTSRMSGSWWFASAGGLAFFTGGGATFDQAKVSTSFLSLQRIGASQRHGTYTGDGSVSQTIFTGTNFAITKVQIWERVTVADLKVSDWLTTSEIIDDIVGGAAIEIDANRIRTGRIVSINTGGFTVGDVGLDEHPNMNGVVYSYYLTGE